MPSRKEIKWSQLRVGALVLVAMAVLVVAIFLMSGSTGGLFSKKITLRSYFENAAGMMDKTFTFDGLKVFVDATSLMYLNGCVVDYVETLEAAGFKFENPNVKSTCGCGSSFSV